MKKEPLFVALSNQKGGVGKSTLTVLLASYFHYHKAKNVPIPNMTLSFWTFPERSIPRAFSSPSSIWTMFLPRSPRRGWSCRAACHLSCPSGNICFITRESPCVISICSGIKWTSASPGTCMTLIWKSSVLWDYLY